MRFASIHEVGLLYQNRLSFAFFPAQISQMKFRNPSPASDEVPDKVFYSNLSIPALDVRHSYGNRTHTGFLRRPSNERPRILQRPLHFVAAKPEPTHLRRYADREKF